jgi:hypothetical protein
MECMTGITIEHEQIIGWVQSRGGHPVIKRESPQSTSPSISFSDEDTGTVSWEQWMSVFDRDGWAFIYQDRTPEGELSRMWKIIPRFAQELKWSCEIKTIGE